MEKLDRILALTKEIQEEAHEYIRQMEEHNTNSNLNYQDYLNAFLYFKLAELTDQIKELRQQIFPLG